MPIQYRTVAVNSRTTHQQEQLDLFSAAAKTEPARNTIQGRVKFFPRPNKPTTPDDAPPFDDPLPEF